MAATSHESAHGNMHMYEDVCVLCAVKLEDKASRINIRYRTSDRFQNLPINVISKLKC